ncbi:VPA1262 family protein [Archangium gephyra]|uniref:VPA1262 family protein n=1 Tax=Archangium gephyra TaxID=48 RepID=UPI0035D4B6A5
MGPADAPYALGLYLLEIEASGTTDFRLVYGWLIPIQSLTAQEWLSKHSQNWTSLSEDHRFRSTLLLLTRPVEKLLELVDKLLTNTPLEEASTAVGLPIPRRGRSLRLDAGDFQQVPPHFHQTEGIYELYLSTKHGLMSPMSGTLTLCASLFRTDKSGLWSQGSQMLPNGELLLRTTLSYLQDETGLAFTAGDSGRLGNIDWFSLPSPAEFEQPRATVRLTKTEALVDLQFSPVPVGTNLLVRCRLYTGTAISMDTIQEVVAEPTTLTFPAPIETDGVLVTIWKRDASELNWELWHEHGIPYMRQVNLQSRLVTMQAELRAPWLSALENSPAAGRARQMRQVRQARTNSMGIPLMGESWVDSDNGMRRLTEKLFPARSGARFFPKGWDPESQESGKLGMFEWFRELSSSVQVGSKLMLMDPYFDTVGLELFVRMGETHFTCEVLTNTQVPSKDDAFSTGEANSPTRLPRPLRLRQECERLSPFLDKMDFQLLDLRSKRGGKSELFHDRYLLLFDQSGQIEHGFHLSNSLQGATKKEPLLVTPIPSDVLDQVGRYVLALRAAQPPTVDEAVCEEIYNTRTKQPADSALPRINPVFSRFFATLLGKPLLAFFDEDSLLHHLCNNGLATGTSTDLDFFFTPDLLTKAESYIQALLDPGLNEAGFAEAWSPFAEWLARLPETQELKQLLRTKGGEPLRDRLHNYLVNAPTKAPPLGTRGVDIQNDALAIPGLLRQPFETLLDRLENFHLRIYHLGSFGVLYAAQILAESSRPLASQVIEEIRRALPSEVLDDDAAPISREAHAVIGVVMNALVDQLLHYNPALITQLFSSPLPLLRALGVGALWRCINERTLSIPQVAEALRTLSEQEQRIVLAGWVSNVRVEANNQGENESIHARRLAFFAELEKRWTGDMSFQEFRKLARELGGPLEGACASSTDEELLKLLEQKGLLLSNTTLRLWSEVLMERLAPRTAEGKAGTPQNFYAPVDLELLSACASAFVRASSKARKECADSWEELTNSILRTLRIPFLRSRDYARWRQMMQVGLRIRALTTHILLNARKFRISDDSITTLKKSRALLLKATPTKSLHADQEMAALENHLNKLDTSYNTHTEPLSPKSQD